MDMLDRGDFDDDDSHFGTHASSSRKRDTKAAEILREFVRDLLINSTYFSEEDKKKKRHIIEREFKASDDRLNKLVLENSETLIEAGQKFSQIQTILKSNQETTKTVKSWLATTGNPANWRVDDLKQLWSQSEELKEELDFIRCVESTKDLPFEVASLIKSKQYLDASAQIGNGTRLLNDKLRGIEALDQVQSDLTHQRQLLKDVMTQELNHFLYVQSLSRGSQAQYDERLYNGAESKKYNASKNMLFEDSRTEPAVIIQCLTDLSELKNSMHEVYLGLADKIRHVIDRCTETQYARYVGELTANGSERPGGIGIAGAGKPERVLHELFDMLAEQMICIADAHTTVLAEVERACSADKGRNRQISGRMNAKNPTVIVNGDDERHVIMSTNSFYSMHDVWYVIQQQLQLLLIKYLGHTGPTTAPATSSAAQFEPIAARLHKRAGDIWGRAGRRTRKAVAQVSFSFDSTAHAKILQEHKTEQRLKRFADATSSANFRSGAAADGDADDSAKKSATTTPSGPSASATIGNSAGSGDTTPDFGETFVEEKLLCRPSASHVLTLHAPIMRVCDRIESTMKDADIVVRDLSAPPVDAITKRSVYKQVQQADSIEVYDSKTTVHHQPSVGEPTLPVVPNSTVDSPHSILYNFIDNFVENIFLPDLERSLAESLERQADYRLEQIQFSSTKRVGSNINSPTKTITVPVIEYFTQVFGICEQLVELIYRLRIHSDHVAAVMITLLKRTIACVKAYYRRIAFSDEFGARTRGASGAAKPAGVGGEARVASPTNTAAGNGTTVLSLLWSEDEDICRLLRSNTSWFYRTEASSANQQLSRQLSSPSKPVGNLSFDATGSGLSGKAVFPVFIAALAPLAGQTTGSGGASSLREIDIFLRNLGGEAVAQDDTCQDRRIIRTVASLNESVDWLRTELTALFATLPYSTVTDTSTNSTELHIQAATTRPVSLDKLKQLRSLLGDLCHLGEKFYAFLFLEARMQTMCAMQYLFANGLNAVGKDAVETIDTIATQLNMVHWNYALTIGARIASDKVICIFRTLPQFVGDVCIEMSHRWRRVDPKSARAIQRMLSGVGSQLKKIVDQHVAATAANSSQVNNSSTSAGVFVPGPGVVESPYVSMLTNRTMNDTNNSGFAGEDGEEGASKLLAGIEHARTFFALVQQAQPDMLIERIEKEKTLKFTEREYATLLKLVHRQAAIAAESMQVPIDNVENGPGVVKKKQLNLDRDLATLSALFQTYGNHKQQQLVDGKSVSAGRSGDSGVNTNSVDITRTRRKTPNL